VFGSEEVKETFNLLEKSSVKIQDTYRNLRITIYIHNAFSN
jgi:hypothetical protein